MLGVLLEAVISVSRKPGWGHSRQHLAVVPVVEKRVLQLPYIGADRRASDDTRDEAPLQEERKRA